VLHTGSDNWVDCELALLVERRRSHCGRDADTRRARYSHGDCGLVKLLVDVVGGRVFGGLINSGGIEVESEYEEAASFV
jgi:hypothetical protein